MTVDLVLQILAVILGIAGIVGCLLPVIPGPPLTWVGLLLIYLTDGSEMSTFLLILFLVITIVVTVLDYLLPSWLTEKTGGSKAAGRGALVGLVVGLIFFAPFGMIPGAFLGALLAEIIFTKKSFGKSLKPALGSFVGFLLSTGLKMFVCVIMLCFIIFYLF